VYQGRFKSFPIQDDDHFYVVCRYVERNALRAMLVEQAEQWQWSSLWRWKFGTAKEKELLSTWPVRVSKITDGEFVTKMDGIIGCDRPSPVDWGVCRSAGKWSRSTGLLERLLGKKKSAWARWRQSARSSVQTVPFPRFL
jgi:hypothetical protein